VRSIKRAQTLMK